VPGAVFEPCSLGWAWAIGARGVVGNTLDITPIVPPIFHACKRGRREGVGAQSSLLRACGICSTNASTATAATLCCFCATSNNECELTVLAAGNRCRLRSPLRTQVLLGDPLICASLKGNAFTRAWLAKKTVQHAKNAELTASFSAAGRASRFRLRSSAACKCLCVLCNAH